MTALNNCGTQNTVASYGLKEDQDLSFEGAILKMVILESTISNRSGLIDSNKYRDENEKR